MRVIFEVVCSHTRHGQTLCVVGGDCGLGNWSPASAVPLCTTAEDFPNWRSEELTLAGGAPVEFKFLLRHGHDVEWEELPGHSNHVLSLGEGEEVATIRAAWSELHFETDVGGVEEAAAGGGLCDHQDPPGMVSSEDPCVVESAPEEECCTADAQDGAFTASPPDAGHVEAKPFVQPTPAPEEAAEPSDLASAEGPETMSVEAAQTLDLASAEGLKPASVVIAEPSDSDLASAEGPKPACVEAAEPSAGAQDVKDDSNPKPASVEASEPSVAARSDSNPSTEVEDVQVAVDPSVEAAPLDEKCDSHAAVNVDTESSPQPALETPSAEAEHGVPLLDCDARILAETAVKNDDGALEALALEVEASEAAGVQSLPPAAWAAIYKSFPAEAAQAPSADSAELDFGSASWLPAQLPRRRKRDIVPNLVGRLVRKITKKDVRSADQVGKVSESWSHSSQVGAGGLSYSIQEDCQTYVR